jgi:hypothetical protein
MATAATAVVYGGAFLWALIMGFSIGCILGLAYAAVKDREYSRG